MWPVVEYVPRKQSGPFLNKSHELSAFYKMAILSTEWSTGWITSRCGDLGMAQSKGCSWFWAHYILALTGFTAQHHLKPQSKVHDRGVAQRWSMFLACTKL